MRRLIAAVPLLLALALPGAAPAAGLSASAGDRLGDLTALVAGRDAAITSTLYLGYSDEGCYAADLGDGALLRATLTPPAGLTVRSPLVRTVRLDARRRSGVFNARWHVYAPTAGLRRATITWEATSRTGHACNTTQQAQVLAVPHTPTLRVRSAYRMDAETVNVTLAGRLPGFDARRAPDDWSTPFDVLFEEKHSTADAAGEAGHGVLDLVTIRRRGAYVTSGSGFTGNGTSCLTFHVPGAARRLGYRLRLTWNRELGVRPIRRDGHVTVSSRPRTAGDRTCAVQNGYAFG